MLQYLIHLLDDRHLDSDFMRQPHGGGGGNHALGDHPVHAGDNHIQLAAPAQFRA